MVTTRSKTGNLPVPGASGSKGKQGKQPRKTAARRPLAEVTAPRIGDDDRFSSLPLEILTIIFEACQPADLLSLCRTNRPLRIYLTDRNAEQIWSTAREGLTVPWGYDYDSDNEDEEVYPSSGSCRLPKPPPFLNEIAWADFLFGQTCPYCPKVLSPHRMFGRYARACRQCMLRYSVNIEQIKREYEKDDVDIRLYSIIPHQSWRCRFMRWKLASMRRKITAWIEERRRVVSDCEEGAVVYEEQVRLWRRGWNCWAGTMSAWRRHRNKELFVWTLRDTEYDPRDLAQLCQSESGSMRAFLKSECWIMPMDTVQAVLDSNIGLLAKIRQHRLHYEIYHAEKPIRDDIAKRIRKSLTSAATSAKVWDISHTARMTDIMKLDSVQGVVRAIKEEATEDRTDEVWSAAWPNISEEIQAMQDECESCAQGEEQLLLMVVGQKKAPEIHAKTVLSSLDTLFECTVCKGTQITYPSIYQHDCFSKVINTPNYYRGPVTRNTGYRDKDLDLTLVRYDSWSTSKASRLIKAVEPANVDVPVNFQSLSDLAGFYVCLDCPEDERGMLLWNGAWHHANEKTRYYVLEEDGEYTAHFRQHDKFTFTPNAGLSHAKIYLCVLHAKLDKKSKGNGTHGTMRAILKCRDVPVMLDL